MSRFLVYTPPAVGHVLPLVPGLLELQSRGHDVHIRTMPDLVDTLTAAGLEASPVADRVVEIEVTDYTATTDADRLARGQVDLIERGRFDGPDLEGAIESFRPDVVLVDSIAYGAQIRAELSGLPRATLLPSVLPIPGAGVPAYGLGLRPMHGPIGWLRDRVLWSVMERMFGKAMLPGLNRLRAEAGLPAYTTPLELYSSPDAVIALTSAPLEYERTDLPGHVHFVGAQPWDPPADRPSYLDEPGDPWVLVTCSTDYQGDEILARVAAEALADEPVRVLITMADAADSLDLPSGGNVRVEKFVPHGHVLPHCVAVICHGGMGIVSKALYNGVPAIVVPFGRDQPEVARRVTEAGAGVTLKPKKLTADRLRAAVRDARRMTASTARASEILRANASAGAFADAALGLVPDSRPAGV